MALLPDLALQYVSTNGACRAFAQAASGLPTTAGARFASIDDGERDHDFLLMPDGRALDAEGLREIDDLRRDFGMGPEAAVAIGDAPAASADPYVARLAAHLARLGWSHELPEHDPDRCATANWHRARGRFDALGGWNGSPLAMLDRIERDERKAA